jgi:hypothetical protein
VIFVYTSPVADHLFNESGVRMKGVQISKNEVFKRHYDFYMDLYRTGRMKWHDLGQYRLAKSREKQIKST